MNCPKCGSANTSKVLTLDLAWQPGTKRCKDCGHQDTWDNFLAHAIETERRKLNHIVDTVDKIRGES